MQESIPRESLKEVQDILNNKELHNFEKAIKIQKIDYNMSCRETDGYTPRIMTTTHIEKILNKREEK